MELEAVLNTVNMADENLVAMNEQLDRLEALTNQLGSGSPLAQGGGGDGEENEDGDQPPDDIWDDDEAKWAAAITAGLIAEKGTEALLTWTGILAPVAKPVGWAVGTGTAIAVETYWDRKDAINDASFYTDRLGIDAKDLQEQSRVLGGSNSFIDRLEDIAYAGELGLLDNLEDPSGYFMAINAIQEYGESIDENTADEILVGTNSTSPSVIENAWPGYVTPNWADLMTPSAFTKNLINQAEVLVHENNQMGSEARASSIYHDRFGQINNLSFAQILHEQDKKLATDGWQFNYLNSEDEEPLSHIGQLGIQLEYPERELQHQYDITSLGVEQLPSLLEDKATDNWQSNWPLLNRYTRQGNQGHPDRNPNYWDRFSPIYGQFTHAAKALAEEEAFFESLARQDEKLFDVGETLRVQSRENGVQFLQGLAVTAEDLLGSSSLISGFWADIKEDMVEANEEGMAPLSENAQVFTSTQAEQVATSQPPQVVAERRRRKEEELEDILIEDEPPAPVVPAYRPRRLTPLQEVDMFTFKGLIGLAEGGPLANLALVGERGPELIINGVVVPADQTRRLMSLGLTPQRRFAAGGPMDPRTVPQPQATDLSSGEAHQALFATDAHLHGADQSAHGEGAGANLPQLLLESVNESAGQMVESALGAASFGQSSIALELMQANHALVQDMRQALHESNGQLMQRVDRLAGLTERLIQETKRTKFYFRDAVRFIVD